LGGDGVRNAALQYRDIHVIAPLKSGETLWQRNGAGRTLTPMLHFHFENAPASFAQPLRIIEAWTPAEIMPALHDIECAAEAGHYAAGFLSYEAAAAFHAVCIATPRELPLLWFGIYANPCPLPAGAPPLVGEDGDGFNLSPWSPAIAWPDY
jgi:para-aminobenzoate synthetase/4-amino-4-deoxychorismate lyase